MLQNKYNYLLTNFLEFAGIALGTAVLAFLINYLLKRLHSQLLKSEHYWDDALVKAGQKPIVFIIIIFGVFYAVDALNVFVNKEHKQFLQVAHNLAYVIALGLFFFALIDQLDRYFREYKKIDLTTASALNKIFKVSLFVFFGMLLIQVFGYSVTALAAFLGGGGLAIGFSAKDMIANFFGALTIYLDRPFKVGDWVRSPEKEIEGRVEDIGLRVTKIRTFDKRPIYVPNSLFSTIILENASRMTHRRIHESFTVRHQDHMKFDKVSKEVIAVTTKNPLIDSKEDIIFNLTSSSTSGAELQFTAFTKQKDYKDFHAVKHMVLKEIIKIIEENGVKVLEYQPSTKVEL